METLQIAAPEIVKQVKEYDYVFNSGMRLSFMVDADAGDTLEETPEHYVINLVEKPSLINPEEKTRAEVIKLVKATLACVHEKIRTFRKLTAEEQLEFYEKLMKGPARPQ